MSTGHSKVSPTGSVLGVSVHRFLSPDWVEAARQIRAEFEDRLPPAPIPVKANVLVTETPFDDGLIKAFIDTSEGALVLDLGHLDDADISVEIDYATARRIFVGRDPSAAMEAFMTGRLIVDGDLTQLFALQTQQVDPVAEEIAQRLDSLTAPE